MKKEINAFDYAGDICKALPKGILMTTKTGDYVNTMVIGWGHIGIEWGRPIFVAYVRESRHTKQMVEECGGCVLLPFITGRAWTFGHRSDVLRSANYYI